jgi:hypothetical protein
MGCGSERGVALFGQECDFVDKILRAALPEKRRH